MEVAAGASASVSFVLSPRLAEGETRIVLTWGAHPEDLDSHLAGPGGLYIYYGSQGSRDTPPYAQLDVDNMEGFGPETITISRQQSGAHCYGVDHFSGSSSLASSGALVKVYQSCGLVATFRRPARVGRSGPCSGWRAAP